MSARRHGQRLAMRLGPERRRAHVRHPNLNGAQALRPQALAMFPNLDADRLGLRCRGHSGTPDQLHVTYHKCRILASRIASRLRPERSIEAGRTRAETKAEPKLEE